MKKLIVMAAMAFAFAFSANATEYTIDDSAIDAVIAEAVEMTPAQMNVSDAGPLQQTSLKIGDKKVDPVISFVLALVPVTGWLGVHRIYMGTSPLAVILNIVTGGGFGIVYTVDWIVLLVGVINNDISQYCNNPKWLMWI